MNLSTSSSSGVERNTGFYYIIRLRLCLILVSLRSILLGNDVLVLVKKRKKYLILPFKSIFFKNCSSSFEELKRGQILDLFFGGIIGLRCCWNGELLGNENP